MDWAWFHEVNRVVEQLFGIIGEAKLLFRRIPLQHLPEFDEQVEIAPVGIELITGCEPKLRDDGPCGTCRYG